MMNNGLKIYVTVHTSLSKINTPYYEIIHCCDTFLIFWLSSVGWFNKNVREKKLWKYEYVFIQKTGVWIT